MYADYEEHFARWQDVGRPTPPVLIVVANSIINAQTLFEHIAG